uniref:Uncharacterized protein n=1 Tax=Ditylum brightwellii TaxID=49249 RepID=A0A7S4VZN5_9STRA|mmetsp:Transcript_20710/g.27235  ORF Transcript_20710/g.27235 Transcript_20710/m.27235 type:complete len:497 (-) Transcript_20710:556-2046(-)
MMHADSKEDDFESNEQKPAAKRASAAQSVVIHIDDARKNKKSHATKRVMASAAGATSRSLLSFMPVLSPMVILAIIAYALASTGAWSFLLNRSLRLPSLSTQVESLESQVGRLESENIRLEGSVKNLTAQNDRLENEIVDLEEATIGLETQIDELKLETDELGLQVDRLENETESLEILTNDLTEQNIILNNTVTDFQEQNDILNASNQVFQQENVKLSNSLNEANELIATLQNEIDNLDEQVTNITELNNNLNDSLESARKINDDLNEQIQNLTSVNNKLNATNQELKEEIADLAAQNEELDKLLEDLSDIVSFINDTSLELNSSLTVIADELAAQVQENREILVGEVAERYRQAVNPTTFECAYDARFGNEVWGKDKDLPIEANGDLEDYNEVIAYTNERILTEVCADQSDFEQFLATSDELEYSPSGSVPPVNITSNQLLVGESLYTSALLDYYFPDAGEDGLTTADWVNASYSCEGLQPSQRFVYGVSKIIT